MKELFSDIGIELSDVQIEQFEKYYDLLLDWNTKVNLTAIIERKEVIEKHFFDSVSVGRFIPYEKMVSKKIIDVGTGAGFPGIPLAIIFPETQVVLLDSLNKRVQFLKHLVVELQLENVTVYHGRAEDYGKNDDFREQFDFSVSRAVANLATLSEYCIPFVKVGGYFLSYKSAKSEEELVLAENAIQILGCSVEKVEKFVLPMSKDERTILFIHKDYETDTKYPRRAGKPEKNPL